MKISGINQPSLLRFLRQKRPKLGIQATLKVLALLELYQLQWIDAIEHVHVAR